MSALLLYAGEETTGLRTWGFDTLRYAPAAVDAAFWLMAVALVVTLFAVGGRQQLAGVVAAWGRLLGGASDPPWRRRIGDLLIPVLLVLLCWTLRSRYALLGDNWLRLEQAVQGERLLYEWGTMVLAHAAIRAGETLAGFDASTSLAALNTLAALPFGVGIAHLARRIGAAEEKQRDSGNGSRSRSAAETPGRAAANATWRGGVHLALLGLGGVQLFCGYVEVYAWAFACLTLYVAALLRAADGGHPLWPVLFFGLSLSLHAIALPFGVGLLALAVGRHPGTWRPAALILLVGALFLPFLARPLIYGYLPATGSLGLLVPAFWWERINALILASPVAALLGLPLLIWMVVRLLRGRHELAAGSAALFFVALPVVLTLGPMKAILGAADWDILAFVGLPLVLWAAHAIGPDRTGWRTAFLGLIVLALANTWGFVGVNASHASVERIKRIMATDPAPYYVDHPPPLHLSFLFEANDLREEMYAALEEGVRRYGGEDPRMAHNLASAYYAEGDYAEARHWAREGATSRPGYVPPIHLLFLIAERQGEEEEMKTIGSILLEIHAQQPELVDRYLSPRELRHVREVVGRVQ